MERFWLKPGTLKVSKLGKPLCIVYTPSISLLIRTHFAAMDNLAQSLLVSLDRFLTPGRAPPNSPGGHDSARQRTNTGTKVRKTEEPVTHAFL